MKRRFLQGGGGKAAEINALINSFPATGGTVYLDEGDFYLESALVLRNGVVLCGQGSRTRLIPTFTGTADDLTNAVIKVIGALDTATMSTTLSATKQKGMPSVTVAAAGTIAAGGYLVVEGSNSAANSSGDSDGASVTVDEVMKVASVASNTLTLSGYTVCHHATGKTAKAVVPVVDVTVKNLSIRADLGSGTVAAGIGMRYAVGLRVRNVTGGGFAQALVSCDKGSRDITIDGVRHTGGSNAIVYASSAHEGRVWRVSCDPNGVRGHASGVPRALITLRNRCSEWQGGDLHLEKGWIGLRIWGGNHIQFDNVLVRDCSTQDAYARIVAASETNSGNHLGVGVDGGAAPLAIAEYGRGIQLSDVTVEDCTGYDGLAAFVSPAIYYHDWIESQLSNISLINTGLESGSNRYMSGMVISDSNGTLKGLRVEGLNYGIMTKNSFVGVKVYGYTYSATAGDGVNSTTALYLDHGGAGDLSIDGFTSSNSSAVIRFGSTFNATPDWTMRIRDFAANGGRWSDLLLAYNNTATAFAPGDVVDLLAASPAGKRYVDTATAAGLRCASVAIGSTGDIGANTFLFVAPLPAREAMVKATTAAVAVGDHLVASATARRAVTSASPAAFTSLGKALTDKAAGAEGLVYVGMA